MEALAKRINCWSGVSSNWGKLPPRVIYPHSEVDDKHWQPSFVVRVHEHAIEWNSKVKHFRGGILGDDPRKDRERWCGVRYLKKRTKKSNVAQPGVNDPLGYTTPLG